MHQGATPPPGCDETSAPDRPAAAGQHLRAVAFDVDGTLYSLAPLRLRFALRYPWRVRAMLALGRAREELRREGAVRPDLVEEMDRRAAARLGWPLQQMERLRRAIMDEEWPATLRRLAPLKGLRPLLERLAAADVRLGLLSDYPVELKLEALGLADLPWAARVDACAVGALKPHPAAFAALREALGVPARQVLFVGDRPDTDVAGARAAGMRTALRLERRGPAAPPAADHIDFSDYVRLGQLLEPQLGDRA